MGLFMICEHDPNVSVSSKITEGSRIKGRR